MDEFQAVKLEEEYSDDGSVHIQMEIEEQTVETLKQLADPELDEWATKLNGGYQAIK